MDLVALLQAIQKTPFFPPEYYAHLDEATVLNQRDAAPFDTHWVAAFNEIESAWQAFKADQSTKNLVQNLRKHSFMAVSRATQQSEIAGYVADDMELIAKAQLLGMQSPFVACLWQVYLAGQFPCAPLHD